MRHQEEEERRVRQEEEERIQREQEEREAAERQKEQDFISWYSTNMQSTNFFGRQHEDTE